MGYLQRTVGSVIEVEGVGLHSGEKVQVKIRPALANTGIRFLRMDHPHNLPIPANFKQVKATSFATTIGSNGTRVSTVEHLLATLYAYGVDNAIIEVSGPEVPIMDGSSRTFVELLEEAGTREQGLEKSYFTIKEPHILEEGDAYVMAMPYNGLLLRYTIDFPHPLIGRQEITIELNLESFKWEISPARTFGFLKDVEKLRALGLAKGGSLENAIVLTESSLLNQDGLRFKDEFVRHKLLDFIGDLSLLGMPVLGRFEVYKSGHNLNHRFLNSLVSHHGKWEITPKKKAISIKGCTTRAAANI